MHDLDLIGWILRIDRKLKMDAGKVMNNVVMVCLIRSGISRQKTASLRIIEIWFYDRKFRFLVENYAPVRISIEPSQYSKWHVIGLFLNMTHVCKALSLSFGNSNFRIITWIKDEACTICTQNVNKFFIFKQLHFMMIFLLEWLSKFNVLITLYRCFRLT